MAEKTKREKTDIEVTPEEEELSDEQLEDAAGGNELAHLTSGAVRPADEDDALVLAVATDRDQAKQFLGGTPLRLR